MYERSIRLLRLQEVYQLAGPVPELRAPGHVPGMSFS